MSTNRLLRTENRSSSMYALTSVTLQVNNNIRRQEEREKEELIEFNKRFSLYLDYVKRLESKHSKLNLQFDEIRQQWYELFFSQYPVKFYQLRSDTSQVSSDKIDLEIDLERLQFVSNKYLELFDIEQRWFDNKKEKCVQLENELNKSSTDLLKLRQSYADIEEDVKVSLAKRDAVVQNYFQVTDESYKSKSSRMKLELRVQSLKIEIPFIKNIYSITMKEFKQLSIQPNTIDIKQFYGKELERAISFIRRDFELLYSSFYKQMDEYYSIRLEEAQKEIKRLLVLQAEQEIIQTEVEIEQTQKMLTHNNDLYIELQEKYAKFEVELKTVEEENIASYDAYEKDVQVHQEQIEQLAFDIAEILRSKTHLETEIIICRHLLEIEFEGQQPVIVPTDTTSFGSESGKVLTKKTKRGPVGIKECASYGEFITLENTSVSEDVNVSYWILKRRIDSLPELRYTFPSGLIIEHGKELKIYAKNALKQSQETLNRSNKIVNNELASWGYGMNIETRLINANGEERAVHSQTLVLGSQTISS